MRKPIPESVKQSVVEYVTANPTLSYAEIASNLNVNVGSVSQWCRAAGVRRKRSALTEANLAKLASIDTSLRIMSGRQPAEPTPWEKKQQDAWEKMKTNLEKTEEL